MDKEITQMISSKDILIDDLFYEWSVATRSFIDNSSDEYEKVYLDLRARIMFRQEVISRLEKLDAGTVLSSIPERWRDIFVSWVRTFLNDSSTKNMNIVETLWVDLHRVDMENSIDRAKLLVEHPLWIATQSDVSATTGPKIKDEDIDKAKQGKFMFSPFAYVQLYDTIHQTSATTQTTSSSALA